MIEYLSTLRSFQNRRNWIDYLLSITDTLHVIVSDPDRHAKIAKLTSKVL